MSNLLSNPVRTFDTHRETRKNFSFDHIIINAANGDNTSVANQRLPPLGQAANLFGMLAIGTPENEIPTTMVKILCQVLNDHSLIVILQKEMNAMKQQNTQEVEYLQKENVVLREQY